MPALTSTLAQPCSTRHQTLHAPLGDLFPTLYHLKPHGLVTFLHGKLLPTSGSLHWNHWVRILPSAAWEQRLWKPWHHGPRGEKPGTLCQGNFHHVQPIVPQSTIGQLDLRHHGCPEASLL